MPQILLMGDEEGTADVAREFGIRHIPHIKRNVYATPLLDSIFEIGQREAANPLVCYINSDIILMEDFTTVISRLVQYEKNFLAVGRRWNLDITQPLEFANGWSKELDMLRQKKGRLDCHSGIDCFIFFKGQIKIFPPFALGRPFWDNWLIFHAKTNGIPVIDFTEVLPIIHQSHDYSHYKLGGGVWDGPEANENLKLAGGYRYIYTIWDTDYQLTHNGLKKNFARNFSKLLRGIKTVYHRYLKHNANW